MRHQLDLRLLRYFIEIADAESLHAAAEVLHVAQPSLSRQLRRLESELGFVLFERSARGLRLTPAGREFRVVAEDLRARAAHAAAAATAIAQGRISSLTIVAASTTITDVIAPFVAHSGVSGAIGNAISADPASVYGFIERGEADFALGTLVPPDHLRRKVLGSAYVWAMVAPGHPFASRNEVSLAELVEEPLFIMTPQHRARQILDDAAARAGLHFTPAAETSVPAMAQALSAAGRGVAVVSDDPRYGLRPIPIASQGSLITLTLYGAWEPGHYATRAIEASLDEMESFNREIYAGISTGKAL